MVARLEHLGQIEHGLFLAAIRASQPPQQNLADVGIEGDPPGRLYGGNRRGIGRQRVQTRPAHLTDDGHLDGARRGKAEDQLRTHQLFGIKRREPPGGLADGEAGELDRSQQ